MRIVKKSRETRKVVIETYPKAKKIYIIKQNKIIDYTIIKEFHEDNKWPIGFMCKVLGVARAAYYKWVNRKPSIREIENNRIVDEITKIAESNNSLFGSVKMTYKVNKELKAKYNVKRIARLMCINGIKSSYRAKKRYNYKKSTPEITADNVLNRDFNAKRPNEKWCMDVTEFQVPGSTEKVYLSSLIDLYGDYFLHHELSSRNDNMLVFNTLDNAHAKQPNATPLVHDDRGFQYTSKIFEAKLDEYGMTHSMSRVSKCIDNCPCENIQGIIKSMMEVLHPNIKSKEELINAIIDTIHYYNHENPMKRFKGKTPYEVWQEGLNAKEPIFYPIPKNPSIEKFWRKINEAKAKELLSFINKSQYLLPQISSINV